MSRLLDTQGLDTYNNGYLSRRKKVVDTSVTASAPNTNLFEASALIGASAITFLMQKNLRVNSNHIMLFKIQIMV